MKIPNLGRLIGAGLLALGLYSIGPQASADKGDGASNATAAAAAQTARGR